MKMIMGVSKRNFIIYIVSFVLSVILIGLYFIKTNCQWCIISCSIGSSFVGAVTLAYFIDLADYQNKKIINDRIFRITNQNNYSTIFNFVIVLYLAFKEIYKLDDNKKIPIYEKLTITQLIQKYVEIIENIEDAIIPIISTNSIVQSEDLKYDEKVNKIKNLLKDLEKVILDYRSQFKELWIAIENQKNILIINNPSCEIDIKKMKGVLNILSSSNKDIVKEEALIELKNSFKQLIESKILDVLYKIGFDEMVFDNKKGYFRDSSTKEFKKMYTECK